jgi:hypothetical protein
MTLTLTKNDIQLPSAAFQTVAHERTSAKYAQVTTVDVIRALEVDGWYVAGSSQARSPKYDGFQSHTVRLRLATGNQDKQVGQIIPEMVVSNDHKGGASLKLILAFLRLICLNGAIAPLPGSARDNMRHQNITVETIVNRARAIAGQFGALHAHIEAMTGRKLNQIEAEHFARAVFAERFPQYDQQQVISHARQLLEPRRVEDTQGGPTLWNIYNVIQENTIRGGIALPVSAAARHNTSRAITAPDVDRDINLSIWGFAQEYLD